MSCHTGKTFLSFSDTGFALVGPCFTTMMGLIDHPRVRHQMLAHLSGTSTGQHDFTRSSPWET
ncbi:hypothetical protein FM101_10445 [Arthrobacter rhombi]|uniref:Uncharacterized protein n=1 Tax=Arthrobacter rhombi TaxID=71253 RepID=A0A1R4GH48_9MICC|nr:hypothetical protein FM101_10445 [Arthrobacter rhombi]